MPINYSISSSPESLEEFFNVEVTGNYTPRFNCHPTQLLPLITSENPEGLSFFYWGINPAFVKSKGASQKLLYAPMEDLLTKPSLKKNLKTQRCIIIADGFYTWKTLSKKGRVPYRFHLEANAPFAIAGLWDEFENEQGDTIHTFMMITTPANSDVSDISDRMPAILSEDFLVEWLNDSNSEESVISFIQPYSEKPLGSYTVNPKVDDPEFNHPDLFEKVPAADQFGNLTLFN